MKTSGTNSLFTAFVALPCMLLGACAGMAQRDENSPYRAVGVGSTITLHRDLTVPPERARVYLQGGEVVDGASPLAPYCMFEVNDVLPAPQTIKADTFTVRKVQMDKINITSAGAGMVAAVGIGIGVGTNIGSGGDVAQVWYLWLDSPRQPNVRRLVCGGELTDPWEAQRPSVNEIREQLGQIATLTLPGEANDQLGNTRAK